MQAITASVSVLGTSTKTSMIMNKTGASLAGFEETAKDFEAVFMAQMLKPMWEGVETDGMFGGGPGEDAMRDLLIQEYGKAMVRNDQFGLAPSIMNEMIRMQEQASGVSLGG